MCEAAEIGVRYCGGCNSHYDRVALVSRLAEQLPEYRFTVAQPAKRYAAALLVCGCPSRCVGTAGLVVPQERIFYVGGWDDLQPTREALLRLDAQEVKTLDRAGVMALLPYRPPILLVDEVSRLVPGVEAEARFSVPSDLPWLGGHVSSAPVLPESCLLEAMAQTAMLLLCTLPDSKGAVPRFKGVRQAHFHGQAGPGDCLELHASLAEECREQGYTLYCCQVFWGEALMADAEIQLSLQMSRM